MNFYTDGATSKNGYEGAKGGWAFVGVDVDRVVLSQSGFIPEATNNICELTAILRACQAAPTEKNTIYSDSAYCINCANEKWYKKWEVNGWITTSKKPVANQDLWRQLIPYFENENFNFIKVKGHSTNEWNNMVDRMAVEETQKC